ncbi:MAG: hypothetical protein Alpg2KO_17980 [Alphaproteobacteria bacterium]
MPSNDPWEDMARNRDRDIALTIYGTGTNERPLRRVFVRLSDISSMEEYAEYTSIYMANTRGNYHRVNETPEQIYELAGLQCPKTYAEAKAEPANPVRPR